MPSRGHISTAHVVGGEAAAERRGVTMADERSYARAGPGSVGWIRCS